MGRVERCDVVVVGAGLAGLVAARELVRAGASVVVLEARDRVGGRLENADVDGHALDLGGQWLGPTQHRVHDLVSALGLATCPTHDDGRHLLGCGRSSRRYREPYVPASPLALGEFRAAVLRLDRLARRVPTDAPWAAPAAARLDATTLATWLRRSVRSGRAGRMLEAAFRGLLAAEPADVSLLHVLWYLHGGGGFMTMGRTRGGAHQDRVAGGAQLLATRLHEPLGDRVRLGAPVLGLAVAGRGVTATARGSRVRASRAIVAIPPALAGRIAYDPPLPADRDALTQRAPLGAVIKVAALYERAFWRDEGLSGQSFDPDLPVPFTFDSSPADGTPGVLVGFLLAGRARRLAAAGAEARRAAVVGSLVRHFGRAAARPTRLVERDWCAEPWSRGGYAAFLGPGVWTQLGRALRPPVGPIHWAGTETATRWAGYMDGAIESGCRAAAEALDALAGHAPSASRPAAGGAAVATPLLSSSRARRRAESTSR
ncbi:MAG: FAD-dependent oxidoreductase [Thermoleophilia bacterium]